MRTLFQQLFVLITGLIVAVNVQAATDSYRFLHVTIDTPWAIFLFLLIFILTPFVLMAMLYWYFAFKKNKEETPGGSEQQQASVEKSSE
jgi:hypothetical protein